jgi:hypothetical protein
MGGLPATKLSSSTETFEVSFINKSSPNLQIPQTEAPTTHSSITCFRTPGKKKKTHRFLQNKMFKLRVFCKIYPSHYNISHILQASDIMWMLHYITSELLKAIDFIKMGDKTKQTHGTCGTQCYPDYLQNG